MAHDVLDNDNGSVHNHSEVQRAQRQQICWNLVQVEANRSEQERKWNGKRDDNCASKIAEKEKQDNGNKQHALGEIVQHGMGGQVKQIAATQKRDDPHAGRQNLLVQFFDFLVDRRQGFVRVGSFAKQYDALDRIVAVENGPVRPLKGFAYFPESDFRCLCDRGDVFHADRRAALRLDHGLGDVVDICEETERADVDLLQTGFHEASAGVDVIVCELLFDLADAQPVRNQFRWVNAHLVFPGSS